MSAIPCHQKVAFVIRRQRQVQRITSGIGRHHPVPDICLYDLGDGRLNGQERQVTNEGALAARRIIATSFLAAGSGSGNAARSSATISSHTVIWTADPGSFRTCRTNSENRLRAWLMESFITKVYKTVQIESNPISLSRLLCLLTEDDWRPEKTPDPVIWLGFYFWFWRNFATRVVRFIPSKRAAADVFP